MKFNKSKLNLSIDLLMFIVMIPVAGIGFLIKYVLIPGFKRNAIYGSDVELYFLGMDRHQWGAIHLILGLILIFLLLLHLVFHWKQIVQIFINIVKVRQWRIVIGTLLIVFIIMFGMFPLFVSPEVEETIYSRTYIKKQRPSIQTDKLEYKSHAKTSIGYEQGHKDCLSDENHTHKKQTNHTEIEIYGYMTLNDVAKKYNISVLELASSVNVPFARVNEKLGRLKKQYDFQLNDLKIFINSKK